MFKRWLACLPLVGLMLAIAGCDGGVVVVREQRRRPVHVRRVHVYHPPRTNVVVVKEAPRPRPHTTVIITEPAPRPKGTVVIVKEKDRGIKKAKPRTLP